ncbi:glycosyltransferase family 2 protein, partial [Vibrio penaeicida]
TIESILNQTFENFEFIIINDCSTDSSLEILEAFRERDTRVVIINNDINLKLPASLNKGIAKARGRYIARMDADDIALPNRFAVQLQAIESEPEIDFLGSRVQCFYDEENDGEAYANISSMEELHFNFIAASLDLKDTQELITKESYKTTRICHSTLFGKTSAFKKLKYNEEVFAEDWDLYNRAINRGYSISKVPDILVKYRIVNTGMCG